MRLDSRLKIESYYIISGFLLFTFQQSVILGRSLSTQQILIYLTKTLWANEACEDNPGCTAISSLASVLQIFDSFQDWIVGLGYCLKCSIFHFFFQRPGEAQLPYLFFFQNISITKIYHYKNTVISSSLSLRNRISQFHDLNVTWLLSVENMALPSVVCEEATLSWLGFLWNVFPMLLGSFCVKKWVVVIPWNIRPLFSRQENFSIE